MGDHRQQPEKPAAEKLYGSDTTADTGQKLLADATGGQWLKGSDHGMTAKLQADGVLPSTEIFDPVKVKQHLVADQQAEHTAGGALDQLHTQNTAARQAIDSSKAADQSVQTDFNTVNGALHDMTKKSHNGADPNPEKSTVTKADLEALTKHGTPDAQAAAKRLLDNWDKNKDFTSASADPNSPAAMRNGSDPFMNAATLGKGMHNHDQTRAGQEHDLAQSQAKEQLAHTNQTKLDQTIHDEQQSLSASDKFSAAAKLHKGEGYYQVADRLLNLDGKHHTEAERMAMTRLLQEQVAAEHGGHRPKYLTSKDLQMTPDNVDKLFSRMKEIADKK